MKDAAYRILSRLAGWLGLWVVTAFAAIVSACYFVFLPGRLRHSLRFYRALFPERGWMHALGCAWRQYQDFARVYTERLQVDRMRYQSDGEQYLQEAWEKRTGGVLVMSHFGRWEIGARLLARDRHPLTVIMGAQAPDQGVGVDMSRDGVEVVAVRPGQRNALDVLQAVDVIRKGEVVALSADRAWGDARVMRLPFLGWEVDVPIAPFVLAMTTRAPLFVVFAYRTGPGEYRFVCRPPRYVKAASRAERERVLREAAQAYLDDLREMVRAWPEQWQTFGPFLKN
jgi:lauroyl/myristoyl acyltransferase